jgi:thymidylate synthase (FAD)
MLKTIKNSELIESILREYSFAGEKGIDISVAAKNDLYILNDDLMAGDTRFGVKLSKEHVDSIYDDILSEQHVHKNMMLSCLNYGFVELQDCMGSDDDVIAAARTSYASGKKASGDKALLRYLMRHQHTTPFECTSIKLRVYMPIVVYRQFFRHRTASQLEPQFISNDSAFQKFSVQNEMSGRYVELPDHFYLPELRRIQLQSKVNKQGSEADSTNEEQQYKALNNIKHALSHCRVAYKHLLDAGVARETARNVLPLTQYTLLVWKIDLKNLLHFLSLRLDPHAQWEVREYAKAIAEITRRLFPETWSAFEDYQLGAAKMSRDEMMAVVGSMSMDDIENALKEFEKHNENERERKEFKDKLMRYYAA